VHRNISSSLVLCDRGLTSLHCKKGHPLSDDWIVSAIAQDESMSCKSTHRDGSDVPTVYWCNHQILTQCPRNFHTVTLSDMKKVTQLHLINVDASGKSKSLSVGKACSCKARISSTGKDSGTDNAQRLTQNQTTMSEPPQKPQVFGQWSFM